MARKAKDDEGKSGAGTKGAELHKRAMDRYKALETYWADNRKAALSDIKFRSGDQWPDDIKNKRELDKRPALTFHKQEAFIRQVVNDGRQNRPSVKYRPVDDKADIKVANGFMGLTRHILASSNADEAFDTALDHACGNGFGYFRVLTDYVHEGGFEQDIRVARIRNPLSVLLAPHQKADGADAEDGFVIDEMSREEFTRTYPKAAKINWQTDSKDYADEWLTALTVRVAEYFYKEAVDEELLLLEDGQTVTGTQYAKLQENGAQDLPPVVQRRPTRDVVVKWCRMSGAEVLEENTFPCRYIPIIPVYGTEMDINGKVIYSGLIRPARDALQLYNYERTAYCERVALMPKAPWIVAAGQVDGHPEWETANSENHPYLTYELVDADGKPAPMPQRVSASDVPAGFANGLQITEHDIQSAMGIFKAGLGDQSNEKSGRAIMARQREGDVSTFHYHDNLSRAVRHLGRILLELIPAIYDTKRMVRILGEDGSDSLAWVNPELQGAHGKLNGLPMFNLNVGRYDVDVASGPSYTTKRQESAEAMLAMAERNPQAWQTHGDLIVQAQDWPMADDFAKRTKAIMPPELKAAIAESENEEEDEGPSPEVRAIMENAQRAVEERDQVIGQATEKIKELEQAVGGKEAETAIKGQEAKVKEIEAAIKAKEAEIKEYEAETRRIEVMGHAMTPEQLAAIVQQTLVEALTPIGQQLAAQGEALASAAQIAPQAQASMEQLLSAFEGRTQALVEAMNRPRRKVPVRDPATGAILHIEDAPMDAAPPPVMQ